MKRNRLQFGIGITVFIISCLQYILTAQVSVPFWDPGELSAAAYLMQVPHPPGGPLFTIIGRVFYMLPFPGDLGYRMNMVSAIASAFAVLFLYLIAVRVIEHFKGKSAEHSYNSGATYISAAIGALALSFCDTFWFNGGEANYFAASTFLYSSMLWLVLVWNEKANEPGSERYLLLITFIAGLSGGLHLMSVLTVLIVGMMVVFRKYVQDDHACKQSAYVLLGHIGLLLLAAFILWGAETSNQPPSQEAIDAFGKKFIITMARVECCSDGNFLEMDF